MSNLIGRTLARWRDADRNYRDATRLARLPDHLLRDMGFTPEGVISLARQIRRRSKR
jgi:uncharacterized protein YjiS (DUF1127 family)